MADIGEEELRKEINAILKDADLSVTSAKKVRQQLEDKLKCNLSSRKQEIDDMVMNFVNSKEDDDDDEEEDDEEDEEEENNKKKPARRPAPPKKSKAKKAKTESSEDGEGSESEGSEDDDDDYEAKKPAPKKKAAAKKKKGSESDSDSDWGKGGRKKAGGGGGGGGGGAGGGGRGKGGGYTKPKKLSPALASLMGKDSMPRHEVVKKMWAMIKERNLYDPNNKQFAICDDDLYKVIGVKRFRTFGMMKYLKSHFHD